MSGVFFLRRLLSTDYFQQEINNPVRLTGRGRCPENCCI